MCDVEFKSFRNLKWHVQTVHLNNQLTQTEVKFTEDQCSQTTQLPLTQPSDEASNFKSNKCYSCNKYFFTEMRLQEHINTCYQNIAVADVATFPPWLPGQAYF